MITINSTSSEKNVILTLGNISLYFFADKIFRNLQSKHSNRFSFLSSLLLFYFEKKNSMLI